MIGDVVQINMMMLILRPSDARAAPPTRTEILIVRLPIISLSSIRRSCGVTRDVTLRLFGKVQYRRPGGALGLGHVEDMLNF